jgi:aspartate kinase
MLIVQKYGGTSVGDAERIRAVARRVAAARRRGDDLVVVVSAMGHATDELLALARSVLGHDEGAKRHPRELDMLLSAGERVSIALLAMAIREAGAEAISFTGSQAAIITDEVHTDARITEVRADRVRAELAAGRVAIVAGFQGVSRSREITTLGRGGSDTSAVALAAALGAARCEIYTDVDGVYTADPARVPGARVLPEIASTEMIELAAAGAQVLHPRAVEIGARYGVELRVLSSFVEEEGGAAPHGTRILPNPERMEELAVTAITSRSGEAKLVLRGLAGGLAAATEVVTRLAEAGVSVDMISEARESEGRAQLQLTIAEGALPEARALCEALLAEHGGGGTVDGISGLSRIALVGSGMAGRPGVYARAFRALLDAGVELYAVSTSSVSITVLVEAAREDEALAALHHAFGLDGAADASAHGAAAAAGR